MCISFFLFSVAWISCFLPSAERYTHHICIYSMTFYRVPIVKKFALDILYNRIVISYRSRKGLGRYNSFVRLARYFYSKSMDVFVRFTLHTEWTQRVSDRSSEFIETSFDQFFKHIGLDSNYAGKQWFGNSIRLKCVTQYWPTKLQYFYTN